MFLDRCFLLLFENLKVCLLLSSPASVLCICKGRDAQAFDLQLGQAERRALILW